MATPPYVKVTIVIDDGENVRTIEIPRTQDVTFQEVRDEPLIQSFGDFASSRLYRIEPELLGVTLTTGYIYATGPLAPQYTMTTTPSKQGD